MAESARTIAAPGNEPKPLAVVPIELPPPAERRRRDAHFAAEGEKRNRYHLPTSLDSPSPVGYRHRVALSRAEAEEALALLALARPTAFTGPTPTREGELFEEASLAVLSARQSTNFRGHQQLTFGPEDSAQLNPLLERLRHREAPVLAGASYTHVVLSRPYRTPFTFLLTFIGHKPLLNLGTVLWRALRKRFAYADDIPTIGYLQRLHLGILADGLERAALIASAGRRRANVFLAPFSSHTRRTDNHQTLAELWRRCGLDPALYRAGWRIALVAQVGEVRDAERPKAAPSTWRKVGANLLAFRSERIQPGVNQESSAPPPYQTRQAMDVTEEFTAMAGRAAYNAFAHWTGCDRERAKELLLLDRIDVLTPNGKERLRALRDDLGDIADRIARNLPLWADLPTGKKLSQNVKRGKKAFALAGQRIYIGGLSRQVIAAAGLDWDHAVQAVGAAASRSALFAELMGCVELPADSDLLAGVCLMAGPVNQNDIGKQFYRYKDLLADTHSEVDPTALLVWTFKAKTVADPIGNEEQLLNAKRKGALVDLRAGPHEVLTLVRGGKHEPMRRRDGLVNGERAFADVGNFVTDPQGRDIPGNRGSAWPTNLRDAVVWPVP